MGRTVKRRRHRARDDARSGIDRHFRPHARLVRQTGGRELSVWAGIVGQNLERERLAGSAGHAGATDDTGEFVRRVRRDEKADVPGIGAAAIFHLKCRNKSFVRSCRDTRNNTALAVNAKAVGQWNNVKNGGIICSRDLINELLVYCRYQPLAAKRIKFIVNHRGTKTSPACGQGNSRRPLIEGWVINVHAGERGIIIPAHDIDLAIQDSSARIKSRMRHHRGFCGPGISRGIELLDCVNDPFVL